MLGKLIFAEAEKSLAAVEASQDAIKSSCVQVASDHEAAAKAFAEVIEGDTVPSFRDSPLRDSRFALPGERFHRCANRKRWRCRASTMYKLRPAT